MIAISSPETQTWTHESVAKAAGVVAQRRRLMSGGGEQAPSEAGERQLPEPKS